MEATIKGKKLFQRNRFWAGFLLAQFLLFFIFSKSELCISLFEKFFEVQKTVHQKIFSVFPFSVGDILYLATGVWFLLLFLKILRNKNRKKALRLALITFNVFYFLYQVFWGLLYFQTPLLKRMPTDKITLDETKSLALKYLELCKQTREQVAEDPNGVFILTNARELKKEILKNQSTLPAFLNIEKHGTGILSLKPSLFEGIMSFTGILGYYNPFTAEAQYNSDLPPTYQPFTLAHESSHQLGFAREQEANFIGYLVGREANNADLRYSTQYFVLKSLLRSLAEKNPDFVKTILSQYSSGMQRDRREEHKFNKEHEGFLEVFFGVSNDLFLKSNQQEGSVTYSYFVELMVRFERISPVKA
ncbi:DUF3810 domain-containing protein [Kaistella palustris]|uniref:DUF3810 domain-containing protein n=1 Tax=Kaistella palustris TaxID=493376 RepID=UPI00042A85F0|nr:DUF3810 domain-containing protein [Kaistella palustris]